MPKNCNDCDLADTDRGEVVLDRTASPVKCLGSNNYGATVVTLGNLVLDYCRFV